MLVFRVFYVLNESIMGVRRLLIGRETNKNHTNTILCEFLIYFLVKIEKFCCEHFSFVVRHIELNQTSFFFTSIK